MCPGDRISANGAAIIKPPKMLSIWYDLLVHYIVIKVNIIFHDKTTIIFLVEKKLKYSSTQHNQLHYF